MSKTEVIKGSSTPTGLHIVYVYADSAMEWNCSCPSGDVLHHRWL